jgi:hypothetical protein
MAKIRDYNLVINTKYLRTSKSQFSDRERDKQEGVCNYFNDRKNDGKPTSDDAKIEFWNMVDSNSNLCRTELSKWTENIANLVE